MVLPQDMVNSSPGSVLTVFDGVRQEVASDPGRGGAELEIVHLYNDLLPFPQGIAVSPTGRKFSNLRTLSRPK
ncbi:MAG: hypothetical protein Q9169_003466 [Polycauliona sp. 2 TL-2023]